MAIPKPHKPSPRGKSATQAPRLKRAARREAASSAAEIAEAAPDASPVTAKTPAGKLGVIVALMRRPGGATAAQMGEVTGWQSHSVRGALAGSLKRKHGLIIVGEPADTGRIYRIATEQPV